MKNRYYLLLLLVLLCYLPARANDAMRAVQLTADEYELYELIMKYRAEKGLHRIPISPCLTYVAQTHVRDLHNHPPTGQCNLHSWSEYGNWTPCCYTSDHAQAKGMWYKPRELTPYTSYGYEIACAMYGADLTPLESLRCWQGSPGHNAVMINQGIWHDIYWKAIGIGMYKGYAVVWFGTEADPIAYTHPLPPVSAVKSSAPSVAAQQNNTRNLVAQNNAAGQQVRGQQVASESFRSEQSSNASRAEQSTSGSRTSQSTNTSRTSSSQESSRNTQSSYETKNTQSTHDNRTYQPDYTDYHSNYSNYSGHSNHSSHTSYTTSRTSSTSTTTSSSKTSSSSSNTGDKSTLLKRYYDYSGRSSLAFISLGATYSFVDERVLMTASILDFRAGLFGMSPLAVEMSVYPFQTYVAYKPAVRLYIPLAKNFAVAPYGGVLVDASSLFMPRDAYVFERDFYMNGYAGLALHLSALRRLPMELTAEYRFPIKQLTYSERYLPGIYVSAHFYLGRSF